MSRLLLTLHIVESWWIDEYHWMNFIGLIPDLLLAPSRKAILAQTWSKEIRYLHATSRRDFCGYPFVAWVIKKPTWFSLSIFDSSFYAFNPLSCLFSLRSFISPPHIYLPFFSLEEIRTHFHFYERFPIFAILNHVWN